jgi:predicted transcriptional regulator
VNGINNIGRIYPYLGSVPSKKVWSKIMESAEFDLTSLAADIVSAYVANNAVGSDKLPDLIGSVYGALSRASAQAVEPEKVELKPAVAIKKSVMPEYIICLEDGQKFKSLKRHLKTHYDLSPEDYREKWGLPRDYPMVAPSYAAARSDLAKNMGLGRRGAAISGIQPEAPAKVEPAERSGKGSGKQARKAGRGSRK